MHQSGTFAKFNRGHRLFASRRKGDVLASIGIFPKERVSCQAPEAPLYCQTLEHASDQQEILAG
jgi:hypothetical protein